MVVVAGLVSSPEVKVLMRRASVLLVVAVSAVTGCTAVPSPSAPPPTPLPTVAPALELPNPVTALEPGRYTMTAFEPPITFAVGPGWTAAQATGGFFDVQQDPGSLDVIAVQFANVARADTAEAAAQMIEARDNLLVSDRETVSVGGLSGIRLVVDTSDPSDSSPPIFRPVLDATPGALSIASGRRLEVNLVDVERGVLAVLVGGSISKWGATVEAARPVVASISIAD